MNCARILAIELQHLVKIDVDVDVSLTGFETPEIDILVGNTNESMADEPDTPELPKRAISRSGDLWSVGRHLILCGDARNPADVKALANGQPIALLVTDVPYNVKVSGHVSGKGRARHPEFAMASGEMSSVEFEAFLKTVLETGSHAMTPGALAYLWIDWRHLPEMLAAGRTTFGPLHNLGVWVKTIAASTNSAASSSMATPCIRTTCSSALWGAIVRTCGSNRARTHFVAAEIVILRTTPRSSLWP
jgi:hypothetical protein